MFNIGELIVYGNTGVCRVVEIGPLPISGGVEGQDYYTLAPFYSPNSRVFTPCDNEKIVMRPIMSKADAESLLEEFSSIDLLEVCDEKKREETYKATLHTCDLREFITLMKTISLRKKERLAQGKKVTASDEKYYALAGEKLCDELAIVLGADRAEVRSYIRDKFTETEAEA